MAAGWQSLSTVCAASCVACGRVAWVGSVSRRRRWPAWWIRSGVQIRHYLVIDGRQP